MREDVAFPYKTFVENALAGGTWVAATLEHARSIANEEDGPLVIKLLAQFDSGDREAFLVFVVEAEERGIWVICGEAEFLEPP